MKDYDVAAAFRVIEDELISSMIRNMDRHKAEETKEGIQWAQWQVKQLKALERYKQENSKKYGKEFAKLNQQIEGLIRTAKQTGGMKEETRILQAIKRGYKGLGKNRSAAGNEIDFFRLNERKLNALVKATTKDMERAETAILRMANDKYRKAIFNAQMYANNGAGTYEKAVDRATKDMLAAGLNCVEYKNGARHTLPDYADMAIRTASKRAYLQGEGEKRQEWGISTVIINKRGNPCPKCLPFVGKVLIDDVWSGGKPEDGPYPLMSTAIEAGLYHPRCKDGHTTYFQGISTADDTWTKEELNAIVQKNKKEIEKKYASRQADKFERLAKYSLDEDNKRQYERKANEWNIAASNRFENHEELEKYIKTEYDGSVNKDVRTLNLKQVGQTFTEFEKVMDDFPIIKKNFAGINTANMGKAGFAPNGELALNPEYYNKLTMKLTGTGFHEAGHLIELSLIKKHNPNANIDMICELYNKNEYALHIVEKAFGKISTNKSLYDLRREISRYALSSESETIAEAIKDYYMNGANASVLSRQIIKIIKEEFK